MASGLNQVVIENQQYSRKVRRNEMTAGNEKTWRVKIQDVVGLKIQNGFSYPSQRFQYPWS
jgi:hypothetical protein